MAIFDNSRNNKVSLMEELIDSIQKHSKYLGDILMEDEDVDYELVQKHISLFENLDALGLSIVAILDYHKNDYFYVSKKFNPLFGFNIPLTETKPHEWFRARVHPEDYVVNIAGIKAREYIEKQSISERKNFKLVHDLRMLNDENKWIRLIIQDSVLEFDRKGEMWLVMKVLDFAPNQDLDSPGRSVLQNTLTNEVVFSMEGEKKNSSNITEREKEVLQLISKGLPSKLIADELFISVNTVNNHRKNILKKLNVNNASEAIQQSIKLKLI